ncbi:MAG: DEAD/DEAH box helicase, partial [Planctomycetes bacterium]|nr:DEAD/DEAH box helicase [Planctomycetota bacterium]
MSDEIVGEAAEARNDQPEVPGSESPVPSSALETAGHPETVPQSELPVSGSEGPGALLAELDRIGKDLQAKRAHAAGKGRPKDREVRRRRSQAEEHDLLLHLARAYAALLPHGAPDPAGLAELGRRVKRLSGWLAEKPERASATPQNKEDPVAEASSPAVGSSVPAPAPAPAPETPSTAVSPPPSPRSQERKKDRKKKGKERDKEAGAQKAPVGREERIVAVLAAYPAFLDAERAERDKVEAEKATREGREPVPLGPLPVLAAREDLVKRIRERGTLLLSGETGSGKTLLSPFFALEAGVGRSARILHTQPRRVAARQIALRLARMSGTVPGEFFGCHTRIDKVYGKGTVVKVATDGIVLQELRGDPLLMAYEMVIVDEAHERSLNIDLLLGLLQNVREKRPELKILISSATLEVERFREFFRLSDEDV